jgi:hypothetical protein
MNDNNTNINWYPGHKENKPFSSYCFFEFDMILLICYILVGD